jgi:multidrug resistance efflux pump
MLLVAAAGAGVAWWRLRPVPLPAGFAVGSGRTEATQIDIATKLRGRIKDVLVAEGDYVEAGQGFISPHKLDGDRTSMLTAKAVLVAARSQVVQSQSAVQAAQATAKRIKADLDDSVLKTPRAGRVQYRLAEPGEVLSAGGKVVSILDLSDVYMTVFLPETTAGRSAAVA